jgi:hypothetical protein
MSRVFQNIDPPGPPPPFRPASVSPPNKGRGYTLAGRRGGGSIFWKTRDIGLSSYSNNLSTAETMQNQCCGSRIRCFFFTPRSGFGMNFFPLPDPGLQIPNPQHIFLFLEPILSTWIRIKINADPDPQH